MQTAKAETVKVGQMLCDGEGLEWTVTQITRERGVLVLSLHNPMLMISRTTARVRPSTLLRLAE